MELIHNSLWKNQSQDFDLNFALDIMEGFEKQPKSIPSKYLYDSRGSELFNQITELPEYYVTKTEKEILSRLGDRLSPYLKNVSEVIEFGGGDGSKAEILLSELQLPLLDKFVCVDISPKAAHQATNRLKKIFTDIEVKSHTGDYLSYLSTGPRPSSLSRLFLYLGSNIGNFEPDEALRFLARFQQGFQSGDYLLIGFDLKKEIPVMNSAYNDSKGITTEFNLNLLDRINRELGGQFQRSKFYHHEFYNPTLGAMQSYLISLVKQNVLIEKIHRTIPFEKLEPIHVENSFKYSLEDIESLAHQSGFVVVENFLDERKLFSDSLWKKQSS